MMIFSLMESNGHDLFRYCYECVNKFSESCQRHCLVCGGTEGRNLVPCCTCYRAYHTTCITPNLTKVPRSKWTCPACSSKSPRGRRGRTKKTSESAPKERSSQERSGSNSTTSTGSAQPAARPTEEETDSQNSVARDANSGQTGVPSRPSVDTPPPTASGSPASSPADAVLPSEEQLQSQGQVSTPKKERGSKKASICITLF